MVSYTQKDVRIKVDGADLFCNSADIKYDSSISPSYSAISKNAYRFAASAPPKGTFSATYFLTGSDPLYDKLYNERVPVSLSFNGLTVNSGYLTSYGFDANPHSSAEIKASFDFYEKVGGTFAADENFELPDTPPLSVSDMSLDDGTLIKSDNIKSINYTYKSSIRPNYVIEESFDAAGVNIEGVTSSEKRVDITFGLYDYDLSLPVTGLNESFKINFKDKNGVSKQTYYANGQITNKTMAARVGSRVTSDYSVAQSNVGARNFSIRAVTPSSGPVGTSLEIQVDYLSSVNEISEVLIGEYPAEIDRSTFLYDSDTDIGSFNAEASSDMLSGYKGAVGVYTAGDYKIGNAGGGLSYFTTTNGLTTF